MSKKEVDLDFNNVSPFLISKGIAMICGSDSVLSTRKLKNGTVLVQTKNCTQNIKLSKSNKISTHTNTCK